MATATVEATMTAAEAAGRTETTSKYKIGVLAGLEWSPVKNVELNDEEKQALKELHRKAQKRDYPARLIEVIQAWEAALFYRGFQFLIPQRGGGWIIPGESTGYGPSMQMDLALLPTNVYSASAQMIIAALTRTVPTARFGPGDAGSDSAITAADSAQKFSKVIYRNIDPIMVQTDASRFLWTDGRFIYWSRFEKNGQRFGWEEDDQPADIVPENEAQMEQQEGSEGTTAIEKVADAASEESQETAQESGEQGASEEQMEGAELEEAPGMSAEEAAALPPEEEGEEETTEEEAEPDLTKRTPRGQEVRSAHGKLECKLVPMMANDLDECDVVLLDLEVDVSRAKGMCPWIAEDIKSGDMGLAEGEIARLARQNVKLGMQSTYVTSDSIAQDVTISRMWMRPSYLMEADKGVRDGLIKKFPNGCYLAHIGEVFAWARNESMDDSIALGQAYSGDGQNRNAMGTSTMPIQKRLNNWLDLMNDFFVRAIPKKWMDNKVFDVEAIRSQTNIPGDIGPFKRVPGTPATELILVEPAIPQPLSLADFIKEYSGPLRELLSGAYPALAGGDVGTADSGVAIATQRDSALGRLAPTWHSMKNAEATSIKQLVRWGTKCRDKSINERIPGGETITLEINDLKGNIHCYAESDENFPETYTQKKNNFMQVFDSASKNPQLGEVFFNGANLEYLKNMSGLSDIYIPQVLAHNKQLGEIEMMLKAKPVPNPQIVMGQQRLLQISQVPGIDPAIIQKAQQELQQLQQIKPLLCSIQIDAQVDDNSTEKNTCWQWLNDEEGRRTKVSNRPGFDNVRLHFLDHEEAEQAKMAQAGGQGKPPSISIGYKDVAQLDKGASDQILQKGGITPSPGAAAPPPVPPPAGSKAPAPPIPAGAPEGAGGSPKL